MQIVRAYSDPRIRIFENPTGTGRLPGSLNIGFSHAKGDFYTWTSDDNFYKDDALEIMVSYLQKNPDMGLVYTGFWFIDDEGRIIGESNLLPPDSLTVTNPVGSCFLYRREVAERVGQYDVNFRMVEDADFWMRVYKQSKLALIRDRYYYHRLHGESLTVKNYGEYLARRRLADASKKHFGISWFKYQELVASTLIDEAFSAYQKRDYGHVLPCIINGVLRDPRWLKNRGLYSIGIQSLSNIMRSDL
jgi:GT2 family glycosyltransferase